MAAGEICPLLCGSGPLTYGTRALLAELRTRAASSAAVTLPQGTPVERTADAVRQLELSAEQLRDELIDEHGVDQFRHFGSATLIIKY